MPEKLARPTDGPPDRSAGTLVRVPGSIANLGPGFDTLSVAVQLYLDVRIKAPAPGQTSLTFDFIGHALTGPNLIARGLDLMATREGVSVPPLTIEVRSEIPMGAGLGSSAAATVAGLRLYEAVMGPRPAAALLDAACAIEGHPDNAAAALLGGLTVSCQLDDGSTRARSLPWPETIGLIVLTPEATVETAAARRVLPRSLTMADAIFNLQRVALLLASVSAGEYGDLREALRDRWHQPYRQALVPGLDRLLALRHPDLLGVCLSGSGPSVVALAAQNITAIEAMLRDAYTSTGIPFRIRQIHAHQPGDTDESRPARGLARDRDF